MRRDISRLAPSASAEVQMRPMRSCWAVVMAGCGIDVPSAYVPPDPGTVPEIADGRAHAPITTAPHVDLVTPEVIIGAGEEKQWCWYIDNPFGELAISGASAFQGTGGHHMSLMIPDPQKPSGTLDDCTSGAANQDMRWFLQTTNELPAGVALDVPSDMRFVVQFHYVNATDSPRRLQDVLRLNLVPADASTKWATTMVASDVTFALPPGETTDSYTCVLDSDRDLVVMAGHMHETGTRFQLELGPAIDQLATLQTVEPWQPAFRDAAPTMFLYDAPMHLAKGTVVRTTCTWWNPTTQTLVYPSEMCFAFMYLLDSKQPARCLPYGI